MRRRLATFGVVLAIALGTIGAAAAQTQQAKVTGSDGTYDARWVSVAIDGDTAVFGAMWEDHAGTPDSGAAYVYTRTGSLWTQQQKLVASDRRGFDRFGASVAISGDTIVVGASDGSAGFGSYTGAAYVFTRTGSVWTQQAKLTAPDGHDNQLFGGHYDQASAVAIDTDTIVVGAQGDDNGAGANAGAAYVFTRSGSVWSYQTKLTGSVRTAGDSFGRSVSISGSTIVVGAEGDDTITSGAGAMYVFTGSGASWSEQAKLLPSWVGAWGFGQAVSIDGNTAVAGAPGAGEAYVFTRTGSTWSLQQELASPGGVLSVSVSGDVLVCGAPWPDGSLGAAYVFNRSGTTWSSPVTIMHSDRATVDDPGPSASNDYFGFGVDVSGDTAAIAAMWGDISAINYDTGAGYIFTNLGLPMLSVSPSTLSYSNVIVGSPSTLQLTLSNPSSASLTISSLGESDPSNVFSVAAGTCASTTPTLAAGQSCALDVTFNPSSVGSFAASLSIASNASGTPVTVDISATAATPIPTLSEWGLIAMGILLAATTILATQRKRA